MVVAHLSTVHPALDTRIFFKEARTAARAGYEVVLIAQHGENEIIDGVKIIALPRPHKRLARILGLGWRTLYGALRQRADIYHFHDPELLLIGLLLKLLTRAKVVYDVHEDVPQQVLTKYWILPFLRQPIAWVFDRLEKCIARRLDAVVVATEDIAIKFQGVGPVVIHNYPDLRLLPNLPIVTHERLERKLVYVGVIDRIRGAFEMIEAVGRLSHIPNLVLDLIGRFEPAYLEQELKALPGYQHVRFLGWLRPDQAYQYLQTADAGIVCLHPEPRYMVALPVKLFEYMAAGIPVIASDFALWSKIVQDNQCGLVVDPLDPEDIARAIEYVLSHPQEARAMGANGRRAVEETYNWKREEAKLLDLYQDLLTR